MYVKQIFGLTFMLIVSNKNQNQNFMRRTTLVMMKFFWLFYEEV